VWLASLRSLASSRREAGGSGTSLARRGQVTAPALLAAVPLLIGVLLGAAVPAVAVASLATLGVAWLASALGLALRRRLLPLIAIVVAFAAAGSALGARASREVGQPALLVWQQQFPRDDPVRVTGVLREDAVRGASGVSLSIRVDQIDGVSVDGGVRVTVAGALASHVASEWRAGRRVAISATLREPLDYRNPGVPSDRARLARQGIALLGSVKSAALVTVMARGGVLSETAAGLRHYVRGVIAAAVGRWHPSSGGVVTAILIGDRSGLDADLERRLQEAGTYHVIAISGGNIALLTALLVVCGRLARLPPRGTALGSFAILAFYGYAAGLAPSVMRATIAAMLYLAGRVADSRGGALNAIAVAAAIAASLDPLTILDPGFVLSFGATLAIVVAAGRMVSPPAGLSRKQASARRRLAYRVMHAAALLGAATVCAEIALAPVGARVFGRVSLAGLVLNFAAIPLMSAIQIAGLAAGAVSVASGTLAVAPGFAAHIATVALLRSASLVDIAPWLVLDVPPPAWWLIAAWYAGWGTLLLAPRRWTVDGRRPARHTRRLCAPRAAGLVPRRLFRCRPGGCHACSIGGRIGVAHRRRRGAGLVVRSRPPGHAAVRVGVRRDRSWRARADSWRSRSHRRGAAVTAGAQAARDLGRHPGAAPRTTAPPA
jgi:competence protein ComEC